MFFAYNEMNEMLRKLLKLKLVELDQSSEEHLRGTKSCNGLESAFSGLMKILNSKKKVPARNLPMKFLAKSFC